MKKEQCDNIETHKLKHTKTREKNAFTKLNFTFYTLIQLLLLIKSLQLRERENSSNKHNINDANNN